jgi:signal transduction histidine kinase
MELALTLGDIQKEADNPYTPEEFCAMAIESIGQIINFAASAIYLVEQDSSDLIKATMHPSSEAPFIEEEINALIDQGIIAWAIRERRGITVYSSDGTHQIDLHVIATYARIRGLFIGIFPSLAGHRPDGAGEFLSLILRSVATSLESIEYVSLLNRKNEALQQEVDRKMALLLNRERELANTRKLNAIASLAGGIAHEFNNGLTALIGYNDLTKMACDEPETVLQYAQKSLTGLNHLASLTSQLLSYSRGSMHKMERTSLKVLIDDILASKTSQLQEMVHFEDRDPSPNVWINCDIGQMRQVINAVLANAWEAVSENGEVRVRWSTCSRAHLPVNFRTIIEAETYAVLQIEDNGCGMDQETRERMFEPFFSTKFTGRGLSLAAVQGILENHGGTVAVDSRPGAGTTMTIYLPACE